MDEHDAPALRGPARRSAPCSRARGGTGWRSVAGSPARASALPPRAMTAVFIAPAPGKKPPKLVPAPRAIKLTGAAESGAGRARRAARSRPGRSRPSPRRAAPSRPAASQRRASSSRVVWALPAMAGTEAPSRLLHASCRRVPRPRAARRSATLTHTSAGRPWPAPREVRLVGHHAAGPRSNRTGPRSSRPPSSPDRVAQGLVGREAGPAALQRRADGQRRRGVEPHEPERVGARPRGSPEERAQPALGRPLVRDREAGTRSVSSAQATSVRGSVRRRRRRCGRPALPSFR